MKVIMIFAVFCSIKLSSQTIEVTDSLFKEISFDYFLEHPKYRREKIECFYDTSLWDVGFKQTPLIILNNYFLINHYYFQLHLDESCFNNNVSNIHIQDINFTHLIVILNLESKSTFKIYGFKTCEFENFLNENKIKVSARFKRKFYLLKKIEDKINLLKTLQ